MKRKLLSGLVRWSLTLFWIWKIYGETGAFTASGLLFLFLGCELAAWWMVGVNGALMALLELSKSVAGSLDETQPLPTDPDERLPEGFMRSHLDTPP